MADCLAHTAKFTGFIIGIPQFNHIPLGNTLDILLIMKCFLGASSYTDQFIQLLKGLRSPSPIFRLGYFITIPFCTLVQTKTISTFNCLEVSTNNRQSQIGTNNAHMLDLPIIVRGEPHSAAIDSLHTWNKRT